MALEHRTLPIAAVQFHPESILTLAGQTGLELVHNVMASFTGAHAAGSSLRRLGEAAVAL
jgi:hypothetical protein